MLQLLRPLALTLLLAAGSTQAQDLKFEGFDFPSTVAVGKQSLVLNGVATSSILSTRSTVVALYLSSKQTTPEGAAAVGGSKRIQFYMLRSVAAKDLANAMLDRIRQNVSSEEFGANIVAISQLGAVFGQRSRVEKGDLVVIDYNSVDKTTEFTLNDKRLSDPIQGEQFFKMMMKVWLGPKIRASTREGLLGGSAS